MHHGREYALTVFAHRDTSMTQRLTCRQTIGDGNWLDVREATYEAVRFVVRKKSLQITVALRVIGYGSGSYRRYKSHPEKLADKNS
jgi:hypothetical protein